MQNGIFEIKQNLEIIMSEKEIKELKDLYNKVLTPQVAKLMCERLDKLVQKKEKEA